MNFYNSDVGWNDVGKRLNNEESVVCVWKPDFYRLQMEAPCPIKIVTDVPVLNLPHCFGEEYHGSLSHVQALSQLTRDGEYLVRKSANQGLDTFTLSLRMNDKVHHYKLYYDGCYFIDEKKKFKSLEKLVADGLVTMYIEKHAKEYMSYMSGLGCYEKSPFMTLNKSKRNAIRAANTLNNRLSIQQQVESILDANLNESYEKSHSFKIHSFKGLNWCEFCGHFLWGFTAQGVKCEDCGFSAHVKCSEKVPHDCYPDLKLIRGVFGIDLTTLVKVHKTQRPFIVDKCVAEIEKRGLNTEGLYRVSGFADEIEALKLSLDKDGEEADLSNSVYDNINVIAGTLKLYFRLLPVSLITFEAHQALMEAISCKMENDQITKIKESLTLLPLAHYNTLKYLITHLSRVAANQHVNKMTPYNLSTVFVPSLMPVPDLRQGLPNINNEIVTLEKIIIFSRYIFS